MLPVPGRRGGQPVPEYRPVTAVRASDSGSGWDSESEAGHFRPGPRRFDERRHGPRLSATVTREAGPGRPAGGEPASDSERSLTAVTAAWAAASEA